MEFEFWWLLALPVFFGMGWVAARVDLKSLLSESRALPSSYFRGLNFLLKEQPDKAIGADAHGLAYLAAYALPAIVAVSAASYYMVERPFLRMKRGAGVVPREVK